MRREINFILDNSEREYLKKVKETMVELEAEYDGLFGDTDRRKYYYYFNRLEDWEKNLLILYSQYKSYTKVAAKLNVQKSTTAYVVREIINKLNYIINYGKNVDITEFSDSLDMGRI